MTNRDTILHFEEMNELYKHINVPISTSNPNLHIYRFSDFTNNSIRSIQPHTKDFHQISFIEKFGSSQLNINDRKVDQLDRVLYSISPNHIYSWRRDLDIEGYILNFKQDYLPSAPKDFQHQFSFFNLNNLNAVPVENSCETRVAAIFEELYTEYHKPKNRFSEEVLKHYLQIVLYKCLHLYQKRKETVGELPISQRLFVKYKNLIDNYYLTKRTIKEYAALLHVTPNHQSSQKSFNG
ncbi:MAG: hypothetical protein ACFB0B_02360 [Thermonemataceae bacterium]